ncbi:ATP-binding protein [Nonomuraea aurantiaca]|uniref:ATP-binding protein n=1 Tax=Nonomuraea aurantiaca TaxID=2878562 RepID=UPI001CD9C128|nr:LuxR family transcriptional regulator [Nonomuraea aurantiaca]MCA2220176.1 AAA family ATPase [Nonomuraea aurantiaca]
MAAKCEELGALGCTDGRWTRSSKGRHSITEEVREAIFAARGESLRRSKMTMKARCVLIHQYVLEKFGPQIDVPSYWTLRAVWLEWFGPDGARQRYARSAAAVETSHARIVVHRPGQVVALDTTPLPVKVRERVFGDPPPKPAANSIPGVAVGCTGVVGFAGSSGERMVGRAAELAAIDAVVAAAAGGRGTSVMVIGEAGIGKSRLLAEVSARASAAGMEVLQGRAVPAGGTYRALATALVGRLRDAGLADDAEVRPYRAALGRLIPDFGSAGSAEPMVDPAVLVGEGALRLLRAVGAGGGCVLVLDDLHWADPDTLAVLEYLVEQVVDQRVLICGAARDEPRTADQIERIGRRPAVRVLRPARLDAAEVAELAADRAGARLGAAMAGFVVERCDGLPLLVEELTAGLRRAGVDLAAPEGPTPDIGVPPTLRALVGERMAALADEHRRVLNVAAVVGADLGWDVIASVAGVDEAALLAGLRAAAEAHLLHAEAEELTWRHALTREAVRAALLPPERAAIARSAAELLDGGGAGEGDVRAAELFGAAGDRERAGRILLRLARHDLSRGALRSARGLLARVDATGAIRIAWAIERVRLLTLAGEVDAALRAGEEAIDTAIGDEHVELCLQLARGCMVGGRWAAAIAYVERAGRPHDPRSAIVRAEAAYGVGDPRRAAALAADAVQEADRSGDGESLAAALLVRGRCLAHDDAAAARAAFGRAVQVAAERGLTPLRVAALFGLAAVQRGQPDPPALAEARDLAESAGLLGQLAEIDLLVADLALTAHGPGVGEPVARRCAELAGRLRLTSVQAVAELFVAAARAGTGDDDGVERWLRRAEGRPDAPQEVRAGLGLVRAISAVVSGNLSGATALADDGAAILAGYASAAATHWWGLWLLLREVTGDRQEDARAVFQRCGAGRRRVNRGALAYADAIAAGRLGKAGDSAEALARGDAALETHPWWHRLLRLPVWTAAVTEEWGDPMPGLRADLAWHEHNGDEALAGRCRDLLRLAGAPPRRTRSTTVPPHLRAAGVTGREAEVLALVAEGLGNAQIAARLHLSVRTVETHVSRLLAKTGAADRARLRTYAPGQHQ